MPSTSQPRILYISYDGMMEPLGQSQVLAYLERLAAGASIHLISFEKREDLSDEVRRSAVARRIAESGIAWYPLHYHKRPTAPATAYDIAQGIVLGTKLIRQHGLQVVHARSYVPSVMALAIKRLTGARYLFDMRGFWADERVDGGIWPRDSRLYRLAKGFEARFLLRADTVVSLTEAGKREIASFPYLAGRMPPVTVIPTCADLERFQPASGPSSGAFTLGYVGTAGNWYDFAVVLQIFRYVRIGVPDAKLLIVNRGEHGLIRESLENAEIPAEAYTLVTASHDKVPDFIRQMHAAILVAKPAYSHRGRAPTRLAEFLGCGVPCLVNSQVGDVTTIIAESGAGVVLGGLAEEDCKRAASELISLACDPCITERCVATARRYFSLEAGVGAYGRIYAWLTA